MSNRTPDDRPFIPKRDLAGPALENQSPAVSEAPSGPPAGRPKPGRDRPGRTTRKTPKPAAAAGTTPTDAGSRPAPAAATGGAAGSDTVSMPRVSEREGSSAATGPGGPQGRPPSGARPVPAQGPEPATSTQKQTRRARLHMVRIDPWSVMKMSFVLSIVLAVVTVIAVAIVWSVLDGAGVWDSINTAIASLDASPGRSDFDVQEYVGLDRVMGITMLVAAADVVLVTALATLGAFMYNLSAALLGGLEVTLAEDR